MYRILRVGTALLWVGVHFVATTAAAEPADALTLDQAVAEALVQNPQISAAQAQWQVQVEEAPQARSLADPSFYTMFWAVPDDTPNPFAGREVWLGIKQRFPYPGKRALKGEVATHGADMAQQRATGIAEAIARRVKAAFYDLLLNHKETAITQHHLDLTRELAGVAEAKYSTGTSAQSDVLKLMVEVSDRSNQLLVLKSKRPALAARLNQLLNRAPTQPLGQLAEPPIVALPHTLAYLQELARRSRPELKASQAAIARSQTGLALAKKAYYPDLMVDASYWNVREGDNRWMLMLEATVPVSLWSRDGHDARVTQAKAEQRAWEATYTELENQIRYEVEEAFVQLSIAQDQMALYQKVIIPQARQTVEAMKAGYQTDRESLLNLVDSERSLLQFELEYHRAKVAAGKGWAALEWAVGTALPTNKEHER